MFCSKCGNEIISDAKFCSNCGERSVSSEIKSDENIQEPSLNRIEELKVNELNEAFIKSKYFDSLVISNIEYYRASFMRMFPFQKAYSEHISSTTYRQRILNSKTNSTMNAATKSGGFNWAAALLGPLWFAYRKMYLNAIILTIISTVYFTILQVDSKKPLIVVMYVGLAYLVGLSANFYYFNHLKKNIKKANSEIDIPNIGGTNFYAVVILMSVNFIIEILLSKFNL